MRLYFLGTGAGKPALHRNVSGLILQLPQPNSEVWLFDCGEGTQQQILKSPFSLAKIRRIFITHLHGDHIFGLPGLLGSRSFSAQDKPLVIYGPVGICEFIEVAMRISGTNLSYSLTINEIEPDGKLQIDGWTISAKSVEHLPPAFGYRIEEPARPGKLDVDKLKRDNVPPGPIYGKLKQGKTVVLDDGRVIDGYQYTGVAQPGRKIAISGDTRYCEATISLARDCDVLVHEATFAANFAEAAYEYYHSTTKQAAKVAKAANVKKLILTHISSRFIHHDYPMLLSEAQEVFTDTILATDHLAVDILRQE